MPIERAREPRLIKSMVFMTRPINIGRVGRKPGGDQRSGETTVGAAGRHHTPCIDGNISLKMEPWHEQQKTLVCLVAELERILTK